VLQLWYQWLNQGYHIYATVGTDIHAASDKAFGFSVVYATARHETAILDALQQGHHYLSSGPRLEFTGTAEAGHTVMMGDSLEGTVYTISANWQQCQAGDSVRLIVDGAVYDTLNALSQHSKQWVLSAHLWCVIEIRNAQNHIRAITNPIFLE
jgi:hypothetical protein